MGEIVGRRVVDRLVARAQDGEERALNLVATIREEHDNRGGYCRVENRHKDIESADGTPLDSVSDTEVTFIDNPAKIFKIIDPLG